MQAPSFQQKRRKRSRISHDYGQYIRYGVGMAAGISVVGWIKRKIQSIPVIGVLASPFLCLMPTMLLGSAVGVAVVYGIEEGDLMAAQNKLLPAVKQHLLTARREATSLADDVGRSLRDLHSQHLAAAEDAARQGEVAMARLASSLDAAAADAQTHLAPLAERHARHLRLQIDDVLAGAGTDGRQLLQDSRHLQQKQRRLPWPLESEDSD